MNDVNLNPKRYILVRNEATHIISLKSMKKFIPKRIPSGICNLTNIPSGGYMRRTHPSKGKKTYEILSFSLIREKGLMKFLQKPLEATHVCIPLE